MKASRSSLPRSPSVTSEAITRYRGRDGREARIKRSYSGGSWTAVTSNRSTTAAMQAKACPVTLGAVLALDYHLWVRSLNAQVPSPDEQVGVGPSPGSPRPRRFGVAAG